MLAITEGTDSLPYASANAKEGQYPRPCEKKGHKGYIPFSKIYHTISLATTTSRPVSQSSAAHPPPPPYPSGISSRYGGGVSSSIALTHRLQLIPALDSGLWTLVSCLPCYAERDTQNLPNPARAPQTFNAPHQRTSSYCHLAIGWVGQYARVVRIRRVLLSGNECEGSTSRLYHYHLGIISSPHNPSQFPPDFPSPPHPPSLFPFSLPRLNAKPRCTTTPYDSQIG